MGDESLGLIGEGVSLHPVTLALLLDDHVGLVVTAVLEGELPLPQI